MVSAKGNVTGGNPATYTTTYEHDAYGDLTVTKDPLWTSATPSQHQTVRHYDAGRLAARLLDEVYRPLVQRSAARTRALADADR